MQASFKLLLTLALAAAPAAAWAQEDKNAEPPAATKKADEAKPDEKKPEPAAEEPAQPQGPAAKKFAATYDQWKEILKQLRALRVKHSSAPEAELPAIKRNGTSKLPRQTPCCRN